MQTPAEKKVFIGENIVKHIRVCEKKKSGTKPIFLSLWKTVYAVHRNQLFGSKGEVFDTGVEFPNMQHTGFGDVIPGPSPGLRNHPRVSHLS